MEPKEWRFPQDREHWRPRLMRYEYGAVPAGAWDNEPDKMQWQDETGLFCLIVRNALGALCGYVGVTKGHPLYGVDYSDCSLPEAKPRGPQPECVLPHSIVDDPVEPYYTCHDIEGTRMSHTGEEKCIMCGATLRKHFSSEWLNERRAARLICESSDEWGCRHRPESMLDAHGGITFSGAGHPHPRGGGRGICHEPEPGEPTDIWWFGFDCAHSGDLVPGMGPGFHMGNDTYKDVEYVRREIVQLARQLRGITMAHILVSGRGDANTG